MLRVLIKVGFFFVLFVSSEMFVIFVLVFFLEVDCKVLFFKIILVVFRIFIVIYMIIRIFYIKDFFVFFMCIKGFRIVKYCFIVRVVRK